MFDVWESISVLRQPCLIRPLPNRLVDADGRVVPRVLVGMDRLLLEHLHAGAAQMPQPSEPPKLLAEERWINTSALQKAIRRGDVATAVRAAQAGCSLDPDHTFRRLAVCALEDVGIGNLLALGMALGAAGSSPTKRKPGAGQRASFLASELAGSVKSRLACDLLSIVDYNSDLAGEKQALQRCSDEQLARFASDLSGPPAWRMTAAWTLAGTSRFSGLTMPRDARRTRVPLMRLMAKSRMPLILYYVADRSASRLSDAMFVSILLIWQSLRSEPHLVVQRERLAPSTMIGGFPAAAYDVHTQSGRRALNRLLLESPTISKMLDGLSPSQQRIAISHGVFITEGGSLDRWVTYPFASSARCNAHHHELAFAGLGAPAQQEAFLGAIRDNAALLNEIRQTVVQARRFPD